MGLTWFNSFREPPLYMAALAFIAYGVQWFGEWAVTFGTDPRPNAFMCIPVALISALGIVVLVEGSDESVGGQRRRRWSSAPRSRENRREAIAGVRH